MNIEYNIDPKFKKLEIIKIILFFPIFGLIIYYLSAKGFVNATFTLLLLILVGGFGIWQVLKSSQKGPSLLINDDGITIYKPLALGVVEWAEIAGVRVEKILNKQILCIDLKVPTEHKNRLNKLVRKQTETSEAKFKTHVIIMEKYVSQMTDEIKTKIENKLNA
ncbi:STM3941 family protein [Crocinitomix catalasitica]|uniref:STM3941 family protein n=1 Tax=Crocinitomix catalasitica TaxID=184607 RepID=UPI00047FFF79|nr:STM3941 family protein [Crocinitomix catalasitica]